MADELHDPVASLHELVDQYCRGEVSAEDYFAEVERRARGFIREEIATAERRRALDARRHA